MKLRDAVAALAILGPLCLATATAHAGTAEDQALSKLQHDWATANYKLPEDQREKALATLAKSADDIAGQYPQSAALLAWRGIILSTYAGAKGGLGAIDIAEKALKSLQAAASIDEAAIGGGIETSMGALYYKVPGWPLGFGDDDKAAKYLAKGLALNPTGIDENYFYADYLIEQGEKKKAIQYLKVAQQAPARPGREDADAGRRNEIAAALASITQ